MTAIDPNPSGNIRSQSKLLPAAHVFKRKSDLSRLAIGIAPVAFGLSGSLVFDHPGDTAFLGRLACVNFGLGSCVYGGLMLCRLRVKTCPLGYFLPLSLCTSLVSGGGDCKPLRLLLDTSWLCGFFGRPMGLEKCRFCLGRCAKAVGKIVIFGVFQIIRFAGSRPGGQIL